MHAGSCLAGQNNTRVLAVVDSEEPSLDMPPRASLTPSLEVLPTLIGMTIYKLACAVWCKARPRLCSCSMGCVASASEPCRATILHVSATWQPLSLQACAQAYMCI